MTGPGRGSRHGGRCGAWHGELGAQRTEGVERHLNAHLLARDPPLEVLVKEGRGVAGIPLRPRLLLEEELHESELMLAFGWARSARRPFRLGLDRADDELRNVARLLCDLREVSCRPLRAILALREIGCRDRDRLDIIGGTLGERSRGPGGMAYVRELLQATSIPSWREIAERLGLKAKQKESGPCRFRGKRSRPYLAR